MSQPPWQEQLARQVSVIVAVAGGPVARGQGHAPAHASHSASALALDVNAAAGDSGGPCPKPQTNPSHTEFQKPGASRMPRMNAVPEPVVSGCSVLEM